jgi:hypothetical protein
MVNVVVNFNVSVDASGNVEVFGQAPITPDNIIVCNEPIPATDLYDGNDNAAFQFWEPEGAKNTLAAERYSAWTKKETLRDHLNTVINGTMDASGAAPFNNAMYASTSQYYEHSDFGRLALSMYAHYLFGHVAATAAITNDVDFMAKMNGNDEEAAGHALLAKRVVDLIDSMSATDVLEIVKQVVGQDASRAKDQDNNQLAPDVKQSLQFVANDVVYVNIVLKQPEVTVSNSAAAAQLNEPVSTLVVERSYTLKITLS